MTLSFTVKDGIAILSDGKNEIDQVGPWETDQEAGAWATAVCDKYNSEEYAEVSYPNELPDEAASL
jgi:hypothetical protein